MTTVEDLRDIVVSILQGWLHDHSANWDAWDARDAREFLTLNASKKCGSQR